MMSQTGEKLLTAKKNAWRVGTKKVVLCRDYKAPNRFPNLHKKCDTLQKRYLLWCTVRLSVL